MDASEIIRRVREIQVRTGRQVADVLAGEYVSVFKGGGVEFEEVRPYVPGDDVRSIDWNVTARTGEPFVKRYVEERQLTLLLMADVSASQDFGSATRSKREAAAELCALLAFSAIKNDDKVGLVLFHGGVEQYIPPRKGQKHALRVVREVLAHGQTDREVGDHQKADRDLAGKLVDADQAERAILTVIEGGASRSSMGSGLVDAARRRAESPSRFSRLRAGFLRLAPTRRNLRTAREATNIARAVRFAMSVTKRRAVCFVVSDFLDEGFERALMTANQKHDVIAVLVTDIRELVIPDAGLIALRDAETGRTVLHDTGSSAFRHEAQDAARERVLALEKRLRRVGIDFIHIDAAGSIVEPIVKFFRMRERRKRR
ncbi:MAG: DUF58 domain-containing protein [Candidatus Binatia bacterium]